MTLDELKAKLPPALTGWAETYGPTLLAMTAAEVQSFIQLLAAGDTAAAYKQVISRMGNAQLLAEATAVTGEWTALNQANADAIALQKRAAMAICSVLLTILLAAVGL